MNIKYKILVFIAIIIIIIINCNKEKFKISKNKTIAIVGNGPLNENDYNKINKHDFVYRFNDTKNFRIGDKITHLIVRQTGLTTNITGLNDNYKTDKKIQNIIYIGTSKLLLEKIKKNNPSIHVTMIEVYEDSLHKDKEYKHLLKFGNNIIEQPKLSSGPSSGFLLIQNIYNKQQQLNIFGMNWNFNYKGHSDDWERETIKKYCKTCIINLTKNNNYLP